MLKKNTRKRLLAGALATVMMLTMCPTSWALADDDYSIATLPANEENAVPVVDYTPAADPTETPADPTPSETEAKPAENQNTAPDSSDDGANGGTDSTESGNSTNPTISEGSENNSQNNDVVSNSPANTTSLQETQIDLARNRPQKAQYFVLLPNRTKPTSGENQGRANYLPNFQSDGGVKGCNAITGYAGSLTEAGKKAADDAYSVLDSKNGVFNADGFGSDYLIEPKNLGFFTAGNWNGSTYIGNTKHNPDQIKNLLKTADGDFNVNEAEVVWYAIKWQIGDYHVDGYVKNIAVDVTYHSNFGEDQIHNERAKTGDYTALTYDKTSLPTRDGYKFAGWYTDAACTNAYSGVLMTSMDLYAKWTASTPTPPETPATEAMYFVLLPNRGEPKSGASQGWTNYLPNETSDGGVKDATRKTGYAGHLTEAGKEAAVKGEFNANGVNPDYLLPPSDLGFFTAANWNGTTYPNYPADKTNTSATDITALLGTNYNPEIAEVVWYTVKHDDTDGYHVDGYVKNVDVTVTYHSNFGDTEQTKICTATTGKEYKALDYTKTGLPDRTNYTFDGWYTNRDCTEKTAYKTDTLMTSLDLYAKWVPNNFEVSYFYQNEQGNETQFGDIDTYAFDTDVTVRTAHPEKEGYTFTGWTNIVNIVTVDANGQFKMPADNVRFDATFEINKYTVTWKSENTVLGTQEVNYNEKPTNTYEPTKAEDDQFSYAFKGWKVEGSADTALVNPNTTAVTANVTYVAVFEPVTREYHVTYILDGEEYAKDTYKVGADVVIRPVPTKEGHTFKGWKIVTADAENFKMPAHDVTIEGTFAINRYTVTYKVDTEVVGTDVYDFNSDVVIRDVPTKEGYTFSGWKIGTADAENFKMPAHDVTIEGTFAKNSSGGHHRRPTVTIPDEVPTGLNGNDHYAYIVGYPDKTVRPQNGITRAEVATIFFRLLTDETRDANSTKSNSYSDVAAGAWYNHAVSTLSAMGIVKGSNGKFNPNAPITRAEFAAIAARFDDKANTTTADFSDIASHWAKNEISAASNNGWITGYPDGTFRPDNKITRAEAMTLVNRVLKRLPETEEDLHDDMIKWSDNSDVSQWFYLDVQEATNSHYYQTKENQFEKWTKLRETRDWTELEK